MINLSLFLNKTVTAEECKIPNMSTFNRLSMVGLVYDNKWGWNIIVQPSRQLKDNYAKDVWLRQNYQSLFTDAQEHPAKRKLSNPNIFDYHPDIFQINNSECDFFSWGRGKNLIFTAVDTSGDKIEFNKDIGAFQPSDKKSKLCKITLSNHHEQKTCECNVTAGTTPLFDRSGDITFNCFERKYMPLTNITNTPSSTKEKAGVSRK